jgi:hypothetical protein
MDIVRASSILNSGGNIVSFFPAHSGDPNVLTSISIPLSSTKNRASSCGIKITRAIIERNPNVCIPQKFALEAATYKRVSKWFTDK